MFSLCQYNGQIAAREGRGDFLATFGPFLFAALTSSRPVGCAEVDAAWRSLQELYRKLAPRDEPAVATRSAELPVKDKPSAFANSDATEILKDIECVGLTLGVASPVCHLLPLTMQRALQRQAQRVETSNSRTCG